LTGPSPAARCGKAHDRGPRGPRRFEGKGQATKYVAQWETRQDVTEERQARGLQVFSKWSPSPDATFHEFLGRVDGRGGFAVVETDDITTIARDMSIFSAFFEMSVYPVLEIQETAGIGGDALEFRASVIARGLRRCGCGLGPSFRSVDVGIGGS
jgi:hypothetical protein